MHLKKGAFDGCNREKRWTFTSFDIVLVDEQTAFDKVNMWNSLSSFNISASALVTKVESDPMSSSSLNFIETSPFDT